jgi:hypothetical protein
MISILVFSPFNLRTFCQLRARLVIAATRSAAGAAVPEEKLFIGDRQFLKVKDDIHLVSPPFGADSHDWVSTKKQSV